MNLKTLLCRFLPVLILLVGCAHAPQAQAKDLTDEQVSEAIDKIKKYLYDKQDPATGGWYGAYHAGANEQQTKNSWGPTSMAVLALIVSGESPQNPAIAKALELLGEVEIHGVYALSMRTHVWSYLPQSVYGGALLKDARTMIQSSYLKSKFDYLVYGAPGFKANNNRTDNSTTQYGILALWQASKRGVDVPKGFWVDAVENFIEMQSDVDGGWAYGGNRNSSQTMTCAGLTVLYVAQQELFRDQNKPNAQITQAIDKGLAYLDEQFGGDQNVHGGNGYKFYGYERVALASGRKYFGGKDWFQAFAQKIVSRNGNFGDSVHEAAFALMYLSRGRVPVWINKLEVPGAAWNNRPNDVYFLNRYISEFREHEVNWQVVSTETDPKEWIPAPLMWISSDDPIQFTEEQAAKIRYYIDMGGTLIANAEQGGKSFRNSIEDLAKLIYPDLKWTDLDRNHPMANLLVGDARGSRAPDIRVLSNGARILMIMPKDDWGMTFQADKKPDPNKTDAWKYITNIYGVVTDRGELTPRLSSPYVELAGKAASGTMKVMVAEFEADPDVMPEHDVYAMMRNYMQNETGKKLIVERLPLASLAEANPSLLHLSGVREVTVSDAERAAIKAYLESGGTVFVENLGGKGKFVDSMIEQLGPVFASVGEAGKVTRRSDIITGRNLPDGSKNNRRLIYRRMVLERIGSDANLAMNGYTKDERFPVLISYEDVSLGLLGVRQFGINGLSTESSRDLMINILLDANKAHAGSTQPTAVPEEAAEPVEEQAAAE